jgi:hypothetical protein
MTANETAALTTFFLVGGVGSIPIVAASFLFRQQPAAFELEAHAFRYKCHPGIVWISAVSTVLVGALFAAIPMLAPKPDTATVLIFVIASAAFFLLGGFSTRKLKSSYVLLDRDGVKFRYGSRIKQIRFGDIAAIHFRAGYIVVLRKPRKVAMIIPPMFKNSGDLLSRLQASSNARG